MSGQVPDPVVPSDAERKKRPAFQFYPADWRKDVQLRACTLAARGLWIDLMCVMHECEPYGHLVLNGNPMTPAQVAGQIGNVTGAQVKKLLDELLANGVARQTSEGVIYSKRMVDDERVRNARAGGGKEGADHGHKGASHGSKGGRPAVRKGGFETPLAVESKPPPSSSSSSSSSRTPPTPQGEGRFGEFWTSWPKSPRKGGRPEALRVWQAKGLDAECDAILAHVRALATTDGWTKQAGEFVPAPVVYLRGRRWDGAEIASIDRARSEDLYAGAI